MMKSTISQHIFQKNNLVGIIFLLCLAILTLSPSAFAKSTSLAEDQQEILSTLNSYYLSSSQESLDAYYNTISFEGFSQEEIAKRKENTKALWEEYDTLSYSIESVVPTVEDESADVYYSLTATIRDSRNEEITVTREMAAILFKENGEWKVWATMPRSSYKLRMATYGEELGLQTNQPTEPKSTTGFQDFKEKLFGKDKDPLSQPVDAKCGNDVCEDGESTDNCAKDCPEIGMCLYDEEKILGSDGLSFKGSSLGGLPPFARKIVVGNNLEIELEISDMNKQYYFIINEETLHLEENPKGKPSFTIKTSSCVLKDVLDEKKDALSAYENKEIIVESNGFGPSVKKTLLSAAINIQSWFKKDHSKQVSHARFPPPIRGPVFMFGN